MNIAPYLPERFETAVSNYVAYRLRYAPALLSKLLQDTDTGKSARVLDLGCGPGFIANAIAPEVGDVIGIDPSPAMIDAAQAEAAPNATFLVGSSYDLSAVPAPVQLVTMGRAFHWMDRDQTLATLDDLVAPGGAIALLGDRVTKARGNAWYHAANKAARDNAVLDDCARHRYSDEWEHHEEVLLRSPFSEVSEIGVVVRHSWSYEQFLGYVLSRSASTEEKLGETIPAMEAALTEALAPFGPGPWDSLHMHYAMIARRPGQGQAQA